jgi:hypothetical protein
VPVDLSAFLGQLLCPDPCYLLGYWLGVCDGLPRHLSQAVLLSAHSLPLPWGSRHPPTDVCVRERGVEKTLAGGLQQKRVSPSWGRGPLRCGSWLCENQTFGVHQQMTPRNTAHLLPTIVSSLFSAYTTGCLRGLGVHAMPALGVGRFSPRALAVARPTPHLTARRCHQYAISSTNS